MAGKTTLDVESQRLAEDGRREKNWSRWGPYLSERQWGTVREDYSANGDCWEYFTHDQAISRAYRWGEDGLLGITDRECRLCFALALWNGQDPILKERLFGLTNSQGNHGEDVKECYFYLDATPSSSYLKALYKYPATEFPYARLLEENRKRNRLEPEFELADTGIFKDSRYFDVLAEYAKESPNDILIRITVANRGKQPASLHLLPTLWLRNTWAWGRDTDYYWPRSEIRQLAEGCLQSNHPTLGPARLQFGPDPDGKLPQLLFTENESNLAKLFKSANGTPYVKDAFHEYIVHGRKDAVSSEPRGTKAAGHYLLNLPPLSTATIRLRLHTDDEAPAEPFSDEFDKIFTTRIKEADAFYAKRTPKDISEDDRAISRQAYAGLLWSKQFYHYVVREWLQGDPGRPPPPASRRNGRNSDWGHLFNRDVISMPDKWEYPWYAAWDLAFHLVALARIDGNFAKDQLILFLREWYTQPNGQLPAYEFSLGDVNPPVHAWACWRVYKITGRRGQRDRAFLARAFHKLLINFTWWVNRKDVQGKNLFAGGFLGLDNISLFNRSEPLLHGGTLEQADGTAWMAFYCLTMLSMALELARENPAYEDVASKFFEHFVAIVDAMNTLGGTGLWDETDGFYYDQLFVEGKAQRLRIRSMVGLIPLFAVSILDEDALARLPGFRKRMQWFLDHRPDLAQHIQLDQDGPQPHARRLLSIPSRERLQRVIAYLLDEKEFLSPYGIRSLSRVHQAKPFVAHFDGEERRVEYEPGESKSGLYGGNSNWRGPIWFPVNYLLLEALEGYHHFYGDSVRVECPVGSKNFVNLREAAREISTRLVRIFRPDGRGLRPCHGADNRFSADPHWQNLILYHEYFNGDTGQGLGASHQTGWTALVVRMVEDCCRARAEKSAKPKGRASAKSKKP
jgi:hypothetical protein